MRWIGWLIVVLLMFVALVLLFRPAFAHDMETATNPEEARVFAFYKTWKRLPERRLSCCGNEDCHAVDVKREHGQWFFYDRLQQLWRLIPEERIEGNASEPRESPDGRNHVCYNTNYVLCAVLGSGQ